MKRSIRLVGLATAAVFAAGACNGSVVSPSAGPSASDAASPTSTVASAQVTPSIVPYGADQFWARMGGGVDYVATFGSLDEALRASDLVIEGTIIRLEKGPVITVGLGQVAYTYRLRLRIVRVIRGTLISPVNWPETVLVSAIHGFSWDEARYAEDVASVPARDHVILFLRNPAAHSVRIGQLVGDIGGGPEIYTLVNGSQAWIREDSGTARVYRGDGESAWVVALDGRPFGELPLEMERRVIELGL
jgi:hypothetical protein